MNTETNTSAGHIIVARPTSITVIAGFNIFLGVVTSIFVFTQEFKGEPLVPLILSLLLIGTGIGLLQLQRWARVVAIIIYILNFLAALNTANPVIIGLFGVILHCLLSEKTKAAFAPQVPAALPAEIDTKEV